MLCTAWLVQVYVVFSVSTRLAVYQVYLFKFFTILSYANSAINPFLYAFTNDAFKTAFADAFSCVASSRSQNTRDGGCGGGEPRGDAVTGARRAAQNEMKAVVCDRASRQDRDSALQLETIIKKRQTQSQIVNNDVDSRQTRVIVHLEHQHHHHQQQQQQNQPPVTDPECFL